MVPVVVKDPTSERLDLIKNEHILLGLLAEVLQTDKYICVDLCKVGLICGKSPAWVLRKLRGMAMKGWVRMRRPSWLARIDKNNCVIVDNEQPLLVFVRLVKKIESFQPAGPLLASAVVEKVSPQLQPITIED